MNTHTAIEIQKLEKSFGEKKAIHNLSLSVSPGEIVCLLGANGAGKTTTINILLGFIEPCNGHIQVNGYCPSTNPIKARQSIAYIPEKVALYPDLTGYENLQFFSRLAGQELSQGQLLNCLERSGFPLEAAHNLSVNYSKGMQQKVGIACALAKSATVLLLDEPLSGLDPKAANEFCSLLAELKKRGVAVLMATHDLFRAREVADRIGIMKGGIMMDVIQASSVSAEQLEVLYLEHMIERANAAA